jgi:hypothetical protein
MNILRLSIVFALLHTTFGALLEFCAEKECRTSTKASCQDLKRNWDFQGSCCSLRPVVATNGCLVVVGGDNNCAWFPKCGGGGACDTDNNGDCLEHESKSSENGLECTAIDEFDVLNQATPAPAAAVAAGESSAPSSSSAPSLFPSVAPTCGPTLGPTTEEEKQPDDDSAELVLQGSKGLMILGALATFFLF